MNIKDDTPLNNISDQCEQLHKKHLKFFSGHKNIRKYTQN